MRYAYLAGVLLLLYFAFMILSERFWLKEKKKPKVPAAAAPAAKLETTQIKPKAKKARKK
ncbi:MAG: hypothetical protein HY644_14910 [Acidobacteria bacterium]|nr:hypothetical protein [Acidobacteriota bacterium]